MPIKPGLEYFFTDICGLKKELTVKAIKFPTRSNVISQPK